MSDLITVTPEELKKMIDAGIEAAQKETGAKVSLDGIEFDYERLGDAIGNAIAKSGRRKVTIGEYVAKIAATRSKLRRKLFQHGVHVQAISLTNAEIDLLNQITHSGRYFDRKVEVLLRTDGTGDESEDVIYISWNNASNDDKMDIKGYFRNFTECLQLIVAEQKKEDAEADLHDPASAQNRRRHFGDRKVTREAEAAAGVR